MTKSAVAFSATIVSCASKRRIRHTIGVNEVCRFSSCRSIIYPDRAVFIANPQYTRAVLAKQANAQAGQKAAVNVADWKRAGKNCKHNRLFCRALRSTTTSMVHARRAARRQLFSAHSTPTQYADRAKHRRLPFTRHRKDSMLTCRRKLQLISHKGAHSAARVGVAAGPVRAVLVLDALRTIDA